MDKLKTNYVKNDRLSASGVNNVIDTINEITNETNNQYQTNMNPLTKTFTDGQPFYAGDMNTFSSKVNDIIDVLNNGENPDVYVPGDPILYDNVEHTLIKTSVKAYDATKYPLTRYIPVGVVGYNISGQNYIIHDANGNEVTTGAARAAMVSLMQMCRGDNDGEYGTPETGTKKFEYIVWGKPGELVDNIFTAENAGNIDASGNVRSLGYNIMPSDKFSTMPSLDLKRGYYSNDDTVESGFPDFENNDYQPSPYLANGAMNPVYFQRTFTPEGEDTQLLVLSDIDGKYNTKVMIDLAASESISWQTGVIDNDTATTGYFPAAFCCQRYVTPGTQAGDWYLPAEGEMGFFIANFAAIQEGLNKIRKVLLENNSSVAAVAGLNAGDYYWSSSQYSDNRAWYVDTGDGDVNDNNKDNDNLVRAFALLPALS